jgi:hypothetical protein
MEKTRKITGSGDMTRGWWRRVCMYATRGSLVV